jgi:Tfp pilus assembly protein PilV
MSRIKNKLKLNKKGLGLVETILALGIAIIVITALVSLSLFTLRSSQQSKYLLEGSKYANEGLEIVRAFRESTTWSDFHNKLLACDEAAAQCHIAISGGNFSVVTNAEDLGEPAVSLVRFIRVTNLSNGVLTNPTTDNVVKVSVTVRWQIGTQLRYAHTYTHISNWQGN